MTDTEQPQTVGLADVPRITAEHRRCGPKYKGCYAHYPWDHCRADGMVWPCDVEDIRLAIEAQARPAAASELRAALEAKRGEQDSLGRFFHEPNGTVLLWSDVDAALASDAGRRRV